jgi:homoprotocatechuate degradation regulator HpaR
MSSVRKKSAQPPSTGFQHRNLPLLLLQAREGVLARFRPILGEHGLTEQQWRIIRALLEAKGPLEPRQIGQLCRISSPSLAGVLARMHELGLVQRERVALDQRRVMISLSPLSVQLAARMAPHIEAMYLHLETHIGAETVARFYASLDEMIKLLGDLPDPEPEPEQTSRPTPVSGATKKTGQLLAKLTR